MIDGVAVMRAADSLPAIGPAGLATDQLLDQIDSCIWLERAGQNNKLITAAQWADHHPADAIDPAQLRFPGGDREIHPGGDGTPSMARLPVTELATHLHKSTGSAERIIGDGLDIRHRFPQLWRRLTGYQVDGLDCQTIARQTRHLTMAQAMMVDRDIAPVVGQVSFNRMLHLLEAAIIRADPDGAKQRVAKAAEELGAWLSDANEHGVKSLYLRLKAADALWLYASLEQMVGVLRRRGRTGTTGELFSAAARVLGQPLLAVKYLAEDNTPTLFDDTATGFDDTDDDSLLPRPGGLQGEPPADSATDQADSCDHADDRPAEPAASAPADDAPAPVDEPTSELDDLPYDRIEDNLPPDPADNNDGVYESEAFPRIEQNRRLAEQVIQAISHIDPAKLLPNATLYVHIAMETLQDGVGVTRVEDIGPIISSLVADWLGDCHITLKPVIDLNTDLIPADAYEIPARMRERMFLKQPASMFPYSGIVGRHSLDLDHNIPYLPGIPGQTREDKLASAGRREHNVITHQPGWSRRRPTPETVLFRAPHGNIYLVNQTGSHDLGRGEYAYQLWHAAAPQTKAA
jgi:hypothetical protein